MVLASSGFDTQLGFDLASSTLAIVQKLAGPALLRHMDLKVIEICQHPTHHTKEGNEVGLARSVGPDQYRQRAQASKASNSRMVLNPFRVIECNLFFITSPPLRHDQRTSRAPRTSPAPSGSCAAASRTSSLPVTTSAVSRVRLSKRIPSRCRIPRVRVNRLFNAYLVLPKAHLCPLIVLQNSVFVYLSTPDISSSTSSLVGSLLLLWVHRLRMSPSLCICPPRWNAQNAAGLQQVV